LTRDRWRPGRCYGLRSRIKSGMTNSKKAPDIRGLFREWWA